MSATPPVPLPFQFPLPLPATTTKCSCGCCQKHERILGKFWAKCKKQISGLQTTLNDALMDNENLKFQLENILSTPIQDQIRKENAKVQEMQHRLLEMEDRVRTNEIKCKQYEEELVTLKSPKDTIESLRRENESLRKTISFRVSTNRTLQAANASLQAQVVRLQLALRDSQYYGQTISYSMPISEPTLVPSSIPVAEDVKVEPRPAKRRKTRAHEQPQKQEISMETSLLPPFSEHIGKEDNETPVQYVIRLLENLSHISLVQIVTDILDSSSINSVSEALLQYCATRTISGENLAKALRNANQNRKQSVVIRSILEKDDVICALVSRLSDNNSTVDINRNILALFPQKILSYALPEAAAAMCRIGTKLLLSHSQHYEVFVLLFDIVLLHCQPDCMNEFAILCISAICLTDSSIALAIKHILTRCLAYHKENKEEDPKKKLYSKLIHLVLQHFHWESTPTTVDYTLKALCACFFSADADHKFQVLKAIQLVCEFEGNCLCDLVLEHTANELCKVLIQATEKHLEPVSCVVAGRCNSLLYLMLSDIIPLFTCMPLLFDSYAGQLLVHAEERKKEILVDDSSVYVL